jgi:hypothetical protein
VKKLLIIAVIAGLAIFAFSKLTASKEEHEFGS